jgi:uncharacterized membrane protein required for colicin V production
MIPVEYFWGVLFLVFGAIGLVRGLMKELGASTILLLSLFALYMGWDQLGIRLVDLVQGRAAGATTPTIMAIYYSITILIVAYVSYEGVVLEFPIKTIQGPLKAVLGFLGGLVNGYLVVGTLWDVLARANYLLPKVSVLTGSPSSLHDSITRFLPVSFMTEFSPFIMLVLGMILLLAIVLK